MDSDDDDGDDLVIALLLGEHPLPLYVLLSGVQAYEVHRETPSNRGPLTDALDGLLLELMWELVEQIKDDDARDRFKRQNQRGDAAVPLSGARTCLLLKAVLEAIMHQQTTAAHEAMNRSRSGSAWRYFIPCLTTSHRIPIGVLLMGLDSWTIERNPTWQTRAKEPPSGPVHRKALNEALIELMWDLYNDMSAEDHSKVPGLEEAVAEGADDETAFNLLRPVLEHFVRVAAAPSASPSTRIRIKPPVKRRNGTYKGTTGRSATTTSSSERMSNKKKKRSEPAGGSAAQSSRKRSKPADRISPEEHARQERAEAISLAEAVVNSTPLEPVFDVPRRQAGTSGQLSVASGDSIMSTASGLSNLRLSDAETATPATSSSSGRQQKLYAHSKRRETLLALRALSDALERQEADMVHSRSSTVVMDGDEYMPYYSNLKIPSLESVRELLGLSDSRHSSQASTQAYIDFSESDMDPRLRTAMLSLETAAATGKAHRIACATRRLQTALHRRVLETNKIKAFEKQREPAPLAIEAPKPRAILLR